jgi:hypothetical protein
VYELGHGHARRGAQALRQRAQIAQQRLTHQHCPVGRALRPQAGDSERDVLEGVGSARRPGGAALGEHFQGQGLGAFKLPPGRAGRLKPELPGQLGQRGDAEFG